MVDVSFQETRIKLSGARLKVRIFFLPYNKQKIPKTKTKHSSKEDFYMYLSLTEQVKLSCWSGRNYYLPQTKLYMLDRHKEMV